MNIDLFGSYTIKFIPILQRRYTGHGRERVNFAEPSKDIWSDHPPRDILIINFC